LIFEAFQLQQARNGKVNFVAAENYLKWSTVPWWLSNISPVCDVGK